ncbi:MAG TPA: transposase [Chloroflexota bacterium]
MGRRSKYSAEFRHDAVELVRNSEDSMRRIAADLGVSQETLRGWVNQDRIDRGEGKPGELTTAEKQELVRLRRENAQLRMERDILKTGDGRLATCLHEEGVDWPRPRRGNRGRCFLVP